MQWAPGEVSGGGGGGAQTRDLGRGCVEWQAAPCLLSTHLTAQHGQDTGNICPEYFHAEKLAADIAWLIILGQL